MLQGADVASRQIGDVDEIADAASIDRRIIGAEDVDMAALAERRFAGWSMGMIDLSRLNPALLLKYSEAAVLDPYALSGKVSMALFDELIATASVACST